MFQFLVPFFAGVTKASIGNAILGATVSAVAGGLSAKANGGAQRTTTATNSTSRTNFQQMRDDAAAAGFNPLTALRMTGGAGNVTTTGNQIHSTPALSRSAIAARGLASGLNSIGNSISNYDPLLEQRKKLEIDLLKQQISNAGATASTLPAGITRMGSIDAGYQMEPVLSSSLDDGYLVDGITVANNTPPVSEFTNIDGAVTGDKIKSTLFPRVTQAGHIINVPFEEPELDEAVIGALLHGYTRAYDFYRSNIKPPLSNNLYRQEVLGKFRQSRGFKYDRKFPEFLLKEAFPK
jgi:hypothetical protein